MPFTPTMRVPDDLFNGILRAQINTSTVGDNIIIAGATGYKTHITYLRLDNTSASATTVILKDGSTAINGSGFILAANGGSFTFQSAGGPGQDEIVLTAGADFKINLSAANQTNGFALYWQERTQ